MLPFEHTCNSNSKHAINIDSSFLNKALLNQYQMQSQIESNANLSASFASQLINNFYNQQNMQINKSTKLLNINHMPLNMSPFQQLNNYQATTAQYFDGPLLNKNSIDPKLSSFSFNNSNSSKKALTSPVNNIYYEYLNSVAIKQYNTSMQFQYCRINVSSMLFAISSKQVV
jgi:hypothetical protein